VHAPATYDGIKEGGSKAALTRSPVLARRISHDHDNPIFAYGRPLQDVAWRILPIGDCPHSQQCQSAQSS
jgi:hypothetical protein